MNSIPIGIIDSGSGGLSIWKEITRLLPGESTVYIGDHANLPYSDKSTEFIRHRVFKLIQLLITLRVKLIVIACNTATVAGIDWYREQFPDIPIIGVVPVIKTAAEVSKTKHITILSTVYTANSSYQQKLIQTFASTCHVDVLSSSRIVQCIESPKKNTKQIQKELQLLLKTQNTSIDTLVLGCTHFPFISQEIRLIVGPNVQLLDSGGAVARHVQHILMHNSIQTSDSKGTHIFYTTGNCSTVTKIFKKLLQRAIVVVKAAIE